MSSKPAQSWFALLRRDSRLFAAVATLLLAFHALPLTHGPAHAAAIICTFDGERGQPVEAARSCPICLVSASCSGGLATLGTSHAVKNPVPGLTGDFPWQYRDAGLPRRPTVHADSIRGPPFA